MGQECWNSLFRYASERNPSHFSPGLSGDTRLEIPGLPRFFSDGCSSFEIFSFLSIYLFPVTNRDGRVGSRPPRDFLVKWDSEVVVDEPSYCTFPGRLVASFLFVTSSVALTLVSP